MKSEEVTLEDIALVITLLTERGIWNTKLTAESLVRIYKSWGWDSLVNAVEWHQGVSESIPQYGDVSYANIT